MFQFFLFFILFIWPIVHLSVSIFKRSQRCIQNTSSDSSLTTEDYFIFYWIFHSNFIKNVYEICFRFESFVFIQDWRVGQTLWSWNVTFFEYRFESWINNRDLVLCIMFCVLVKDLMQTIKCHNFSIIQDIIIILLSSHRFPLLMPSSSIISTLSSSVFRFPFGESAIKNVNIWSSKYFIHPIYSRRRQHSYFIITYYSISDSNIKGFHKVDENILGRKHKREGTGSIADFL